MIPLDEKRLVEEAAHLDSGLPGLNYRSGLEVNFG